MIGEKIIACDYEPIESSGLRKLVLDCKRCGKDHHEISDCLSEIILVLEDEYKIESLIASDHIEIQYVGPGLDILFQITGISREIRTFSTRDSDKEKCKRCGFRPSNFYSQLRKDFIEDPGIIYSELKRVSEKLEKGDHCSGCKETIEEELEILGKKALSLRSEVLKEGFGIVKKM